MDWNIYKNEDETHVLTQRCLALSNENNRDLGRMFYNVSEELLTGQNFVTSIVSFRSIWFCQIPFYMKIPSDVQHQLPQLVNPSTVIYSLIPSQGWNC